MKTTMRQHYEDVSTRIGGSDLQRVHCISPVREFVRRMREKKKKNI